ncbi:MAG: hypothetical protein A3F16_02500 [Deltaproteobacteria bacterium RIFCSPHIGHO2_12_FULL_43_9]|nr:MAG: hypothetical protein A3F16_02500 [Deltaproteobacteria bacterium RIFCSPHIGHO2_12_FULL_43_9]
MEKTIRLVLVAFAVGFTLAFIQFGLIYTLNIRFASTVSVYLILFGAWLFGMMLGLITPDIRYSRWVAAASLSYLIFCVSLLIDVPNNIVNFLAIVSAMFSGAWGMRFVRVFSAYYPSARMVLLWENNGFIVGIILTLCVIIFYGLFVSFVSTFLIVSVPWLPIIWCGRPQEALGKISFKKT